MCKKRLSKINTNGKKNLESTTMNAISVESVWAEFDAFRQTQEPPPTTKLTNKSVDIYICNCGGTKVFGSDGIPVCTGCGIVDHGFLDDGPEWSSGVNEDGSVSDPARCGMPKDLELFSEQWGCGTVMVSKYATYAQKRLARINFHSSMNHKDRALFHAYKDIDSAAKTVLELSEGVLRDSKIMYRKFNKEKLTRGAVRSGVKANCVLYACKMNNVPRTTKEIADAFGIPTKDISRTSDLFKQTILGEMPKVTEHKITKPCDVVGRLLNDFDIPDRRRARVECSRMAIKLEECVTLMGKTPNSVAAVIIYKVLGISKSEIVAKCNVSAPTINKIDGIINKYLEEQVAK